ncbi:MAG TPA: hypothetical protein O0X38_06710, partial [Methanocorpusculum sp.]|nr:hypothetical protein [Methanocorpusculum sp.]
MTSIPQEQPEPPVPETPAPTKTYSVYLDTDAAESQTHGIFAVYPLRNPENGHTTGKRPCGLDGKVAGGVYNLTHTAGKVMEILDSPKRTNYVINSVRGALVYDATTKEDADYLRNVEIRLCLGRRFGAGDGIICIDCDGFHPPAEWTNGTGYRETSASGTGDHIVARIPQNLIPDENNKIKRPREGGGDIEIFYGRGNGVAISGFDAVAGVIDLDMNSDCGKMVTSMLSPAPSQTPETAPVQVAPAPVPTAPEKTDDEIILLVQKTAKGRALWSGDTSGYDSDSEADDALMIRLADLTGQNWTQMERLFRKSGLGKRKKAQRPDYLPRTIKHACSVVQNSPQAPKNVMYEEGDDDQDAPEDTYDYAAEDEKIESLMDRAPEPLKSLVNYYNKTSPIDQPVFAMEAALIAASSVLARNWVTDWLIFSRMSLPPSTTNDYTMILTPTAHGKDVIKDFLQNAIANPCIPQPAGSSARSTLHKRLQAYPRTIWLMDEAGKRIAETGRDPAGVKQGAETLAMEIYGRRGIIEPQDYADTKDSPILKPIIRHGLTVVRTSTPETVTDAVTYGAVRDGWFARQRVIVSYRKRPTELGTYQPDATREDPRDLLRTWNEWRDAHIGMPEADTYQQAVNPITAVAWGYKIPAEYRYS